MPQKIQPTISLESCCIFCDIQYLGSIPIEFSVITCTQQLHPFEHIPNQSWYFSTSYECFWTALIMSANFSVISEHFQRDFKDFQRMLKTHKNFWKTVLKLFPKFSKKLICEHFQKFLKFFIYILKWQTTLEPFPKLYTPISKRVT